MRIEEARERLQEGCQIYCKWIDTGQPEMDSSRMAYTLYGIIRQANALLQPDPEDDVRHCSWDQLCHELSLVPSSQLPELLRQLARRAAKEAFVYPCDCMLYIEHCLVSLEEPVDNLPIAVLQSRLRKLCDTPLDNLESETAEVVQFLTGLLERREK